MVSRQMSRECMIMDKSFIIVLILYEINKQNMRMAFSYKTTFHKELWEEITPFCLDQAPLVFPSSLALKTENPLSLLEINSYKFYSCFACPPNNRGLCPLKRILARLGSIQLANLSNPLIALT